MRFFVSLAWVALLLIVLACGGGGGTTGSGATIVISPASAAPALGQQVGFTATITGLANNTVLWSTTGGSIVATGPNTATYTAPNVAGNFTVTARADGDNSVVASAAVTVSTIGVSISPVQSTVAVGRTLNFTATVTGTANQNVTWTTTNGTIVSTGANTARYTAPATVGVAKVRATSVANTSRFAEANVAISASVGNNAIVTGRVVNQASSTGVAGVSVLFLNSSGVSVAQATTTANGTFSAQVPVTATRFHLDSASISAGFYKSYEYNTKRYSALISTCSAPLPTLTAGVTSALPTNIEIPPASGPPPPPPNGCQ